MAMRPPNYQIQGGGPNLMNEPTAMEALTNLGMQKGMDYGMEMMFPGSSLAKEAGAAVLPSLFNEGGAVYLRPGGDAPGYLDQGFNWAGSRRNVYDRVNKAYEQAAADRSKEDAYLIKTYGKEGIKPGGGKTTWYENVKNMLGKEAADKAKKEAEQAAKDQKAAAEAERAAMAQREREMGRTGGAGVDWNVGLGNVGGWDLSTQGNFTRGGEDIYGTKDKDSYNVRLNAARGMDWNKMMGMAPLGGPAAKGRYSDYEGGEYRERLPGERITTDIARGRRAAPAPAGGGGGDPLQAYLDAGISRDQAEMLAANKVPPPRPMMRGGAVYLNEGGKVPWWKAAAKYIMNNDNMAKRAQKQRQKTQKAKESTFDWGALLGSLGSSALGFNTGGKVSPAAGMYGPIGGMTPGPLGMSDMIAAGKDKDISKVVYKKSGGDVAQQVEIAYHDPNKPKAPLAGANSASSNS